MQAEPFNVTHLHFFVCSSNGFKNSFFLDSAKVYSPIIMIQLLNSMLMFTSVIFQLDRVILICFLFFDIKSK